MMDKDIFCSSVIVSGCSWVWCRSSRRSGKGLALQPCRTPVWPCRLLFYCWRFSPQVHEPFLSSYPCASDLVLTSQTAPVSRAVPFWCGPFAPALM
jgi:hypothetical protein